MPVKPWQLFLQFLVMATIPSGSKNQKFKMVDFKMATIRRLMAVIDIFMRVMLENEDNKKNGLDCVMTMGWDLMVMT